MKYAASQNHRRRPLTSLRLSGVLRSGVLLGCIVLANFGCTPGKNLPSAMDAIAVMRLLRDSGKVGAEFEKRPDFWARSWNTPLTYDEREWLMPLFASFVDEDLALGSFARRFLHEQGTRTNTRELALVRSVGLGSFSKQLRERLRLLDLVGDNAAIFTALDEGSPEYGIAKGQLTRIAIETARPDTALQLDIGIDALQESRKVLPKVGLEPGDINAAWQSLAARRRAMLAGTTMTKAEMSRTAKLEVDPLLATVASKSLAVARDARRAHRKVAGKLLRHMIGVMIGNEVAGVLDPLVADIALWMGDTRLRGNGRHMISEAQLDTLLPDLQPGDIMLERRNWYLSNLGLPGFWPHTAFFIGSPAELEKWADDDGVRKLFPNGLIAHIQETYPVAFAAYSEQHDGHPSRVIEAVSEGVIFSSYYHSCLADHVGFLRPRRTKAERAWAIAQSFRHYGKPYDFTFDFRSISALVCSELVYVSYNLPKSVGRRLELDPLPEVFGIVTLPPNELIARFDREYGTPDQQFDFVAFLDGRERDNKAVRGTVADFRRTWLRPKWDLNQ